MSAADLIQKFGVTVTVTRKEAGSYVEGKYQEGAATTFEAVLSIQPLTDKERLNLTEGQRTKRVLKAYSATELRTVDEEAKIPADRISFDGTEFEVIQVQTWPGNLNHWKVQLVEVNR